MSVITTHGYHPDPEEPEKWRVFWEEQGMRMEMGPFDTFKEAQTFCNHFHDHNADGWVYVERAFKEAHKLHELAQKLNAAPSEKAGVR